MVILLGGLIGLVLNLVCDLGLWLVYVLFLVLNKGSFYWEYSWVFVVVLIVGVVIGIWIYKIFFGL